MSPEPISARKETAPAGLAEGDGAAKSVINHITINNLIDLVARGREPFYHLSSAFQISRDLIDTPTSFLPVPDCEATAAAMRLSTHVLREGRLALIGYRSENAGSEFVNLVPMPGEGRFAEKSVKDMRGHTDAASFPFPGEVDPKDQRTARAPDVVLLACLRNPDAAATKIIPLPKVLEKLNGSQIEELQRPQYIIRCQQTFEVGTKEVFGRPHEVFDAPVLRKTDEGFQVRFSHRRVVADIDEYEGEGAAAQEALEAFKEAVSQSAVGIVLQPGDILLINNRVALHGRSELSYSEDGKSRWLLRCYGMLEENLCPSSFLDETGRLLFP